MPKDGRRLKERLKNALGVFMECAGKSDVAETLAAIASLGFNAVQLTTLPQAFYSAKGAEKLKALLAENGLTATSVCMVFAGETYADFDAVVNTVGYRPEATFADRLHHSRHCVDLAARIGAPLVTTHMGVLPKAEHDPIYQRMLAGVGAIAFYGREHNVRLSLETGQESADELLKFLDKMRHLHVGVNFDTANLVLYGMDDPPGALARLLPHVTSVHVKDGAPPAQPGALGAEARLGEGKAQVARCLRLLKAADFRGPLIVENYVAALQGTDPLDELRRAKEFIEQVLGEA